MKPRKRTRIERTISGDTGTIREVFIDSGKVRRVLLEITDTDPNSLRLQLRGAESYFLTQSNQ